VPGTASGALATTLRRAWRWPCLSVPAFALSRSSSCSIQTGQRDGDVQVELQAFRVQSYKRIEDTGWVSCHDLMVARGQERGR